MAGSLLPRLAIAMGIVALAAMACEDELMPPGTAAPPPSAAPSSSGPTVPKPKLASASASVSASASASASAGAPMPSLTVAAPAGPLKWTDFGGPTVAAEVKAGEQAWAVLPVSAGWDTLKWMLVSVDRVEGNDAVLKGASSDKRDIYVPLAFTQPARPTDSVVKGDAVWVTTKGGRAFARVTSMEGGKVKVRFRYAGELQELEIDPAGVVKLDGSLKFGAVAAYSETKEDAGKTTTEWHPAYYVQNGESKAWVVTANGKPIRVPLVNVKPLGVHVSHKAGDKIWFAKGESLVPGTVGEVEDDGLRYRLKLDAGEETTAPFEVVSTPIR